MVRMAHRRVVLLLTANYVSDSCIHSPLLFILPMYSGAGDSSGGVVGASIIRHVEVETGEPPVIVRVGVTGVFPAAVLAMATAAAVAAAASVLEVIGINLGGIYVFRFSRCRTPCSRSPVPAPPSPCARTPSGKRRTCRIL